MTKEEVTYYRKNLKDVSNRLKDLAGKYRMQNSGDYKELKAIVDELQDRTERNAKDETDE